MLNLSGPAALGPAIISGDWRQSQRLGRVGTILTELSYRLCRVFSTDGLTVRRTKPFALRRDGAGKRPPKLRISESWSFRFNGTLATARLDVSVYLRHGIRAVSTVVPVGVRLGERVDSVSEQC